MLNNVVYVLDKARPSVTEEAWDNELSDNIGAFLFSEKFYTHFQWVEG